MKITSRFVDLLHIHLALTLSSATGELDQGSFSSQALPQQWKLPLTNFFDYQNVLTPSSLAMPIWFCLWNFHVSLLYCWQEIEVIWRIQVWGFHFIADMIPGVNIMDGKASTPSTNSAWGSGGGLSPPRPLPPSTSEGLWEHSPLSKCFGSKWHPDWLKIGLNVAEIITVQNYKCTKN